MSGNDATFVAQYEGLEFSETTLVLNRFHFTKANLSGSIGDNARRGVIAAFKKAYCAQHHTSIDSLWLEFDELELTETDESQVQLSGCGCECAGCDDQGRHCHKTDKGCFL